MKPNTVQQVPVELKNFLLTGDAARTELQSAESNSSSSPLQQRTRNAGEESSARRPTTTAGAAAGAAAGATRGIGGLVQNFATDQISTLKFRIGSKPGESLRSHEVCYLRFKSAGQSTEETICIHHLSSIDLSPVSLRT